MKSGELKVFRETAGLTQVDYADQLGIHPITLSRYERDAEPIPRLVDLAIHELARRLQAKAKNGTKPRPKK